MPREIKTHFLYAARDVCAHFDIHVLVQKIFACEKPLSGKFEVFVPLGVDRVHCLQYGRRSSVLQCEEKFNDGVKGAQVLRK